MKINVIYLFISLIAIWFQAAGSLALNSYWEREEDKLMDRTKNRPLPSGRMKPQVALWWGWGLVACGTIVLIWSANLLTAFLGLLAVVIYIFIYTPLKAIGPYALYVGAVPGALPAVMGWTTVTNTLASMGSYLFGVLFLWQIPHFLAISYFRKSEYDLAQFKTFAQTHSFNFIRWNIILYSFLLCIYSLVPYWAGVRSVGYFWGSMTLGVLFCIGALVGLRTPHPQRWSRGYFWTTLFYLPIQLGLLLIFS
jgi:protoheme IX farnesyltransferase